MAHMVNVMEYEEVLTTIADSGGIRHCFDVLLECGHLQTVETSMPTPPKRVMCRECLDLPENVVVMS